MQSKRPAIRTPWIRCLPVMAVFAAALFGANPAHADNETQRRSLAGLGGAHLHLTLEGDDLESHQLTEATLRPEIEAGLAATGLRLLTPETSAQEPGVPWLFASVALQKSQDGKVYAWSVRLELEQRACLERDPKACGSAVTWSSHRFGSVGRRRVQTLHQDVMDSVNEFVAAYVAANPRH